MTTRTQSMPSCKQMDNPCPLQKPKGTIKTRGITAYDLLKENSPFKLKRTQKQIQSVNKQFNHPKFLHILIDRRNGFGGKALAKKHGGTYVKSITKFLTEMGFSKIKPSERLLSNGKKHKKDAQKIYEEEWMKEVESVKKDITWSRHPAVYNWNLMQKYYANPDKYNERAKAWKAKNKDKVSLMNKAYGKNYRSENAEKIAAYNNHYKKNNLEKIRENARRQRLKPINKIKSNLRKRLRQYLKANGAKWGGFGCSSNELRDHLERQFTKGMTWDNYGTFWHVDHIRPLASFNLYDKEQRKIANHYSNLQPLTADENIKKSDNWGGQCLLAL